MSLPRLPDWSPQRYRRQQDEESGVSDGWLRASHDDSDAFDIPPPKKASVERLKRWREQALPPADENTSAVKQQSLVGASMQEGEDGGR
ncbi:hypothetical protein EJ110_NYTH24696 [Nymphaea thermarum]|nr:hypothetical protein EJ110_NYTH24696 [Nymphaea thermarum]